MSSVNMAGSRLLAPYTVEVDFTTRCRTDGAFWAAARSCIVPMTLSSFIVPRPPALPGVAMTLMWTTVSTSSFASTFAITGVRMSARMKDIPPTSPCGGATSTPITRSMPSTLARARAKRRPRSRETPVTSATRPMVRALGAAAEDYLPSLRRWTRVFLSSLRCFFFAMRLRRFLMTEPTRKPFTCWSTRGSARGTEPAYRPAGRQQNPGRTPVTARPGVAAPSAGRSAGRSSGAVEALAEVLVDVVLGPPEGATDADSGELAVVHEPVDGHLRDPHH